MPFLVSSARPSGRGRNSNIELFGDEITFTPDHLLTGVVDALSRYTVTNQLRAFLAYPGAGPTLSAATMEPLGFET